MVDQGLNDFTVTVTKKNSGNAGIVAECVASEGECKIHYITFTQDVQVCCSFKIFAFL